MKITDLISINNKGVNGSISGVILLAVLTAVLSISDVSGQIYPASPANWLYPNGSPEATKNVIKASDKQNVSSFGVKWATGSISGDVKPLVGNIINNPPLFPQYPYAPNEIAAVVGGKIIIVDAYGKTHKKPNSVSFINSITCLFDTTKRNLDYSITNPVVMGLELIERDASAANDSIAYSYLASFDGSADTAEIIQRMAIDLRPFADNGNIAASIKPIYGVALGETNSIFAIINTSKPKITDPFAFSAQYFRGFTRFKTPSVYYKYPMPDIGDDPLTRIYLGPECTVGEASITKMLDDRTVVALPSYPTTSLSNVQVPGDPKGFATFADRPYLTTAFAGDEFALNTEFIPLDLSFFFDQTAVRPAVNPYYVKLRDPSGADSVYILMAEQYKGIEGSKGISKLHLMRTNGDSITYFVNSSDEMRIPCVTGDSNHMWSVAVGNLDGNSNNSWGPYLPNNPGKEIIATQSSSDFAYPQSRLFVMRYNPGDPTPKASPPGTYLNPFDTIYTCRMSGRVVAVNDLDGADDGKDEIVIADGGKIRILRQRDYSDPRFRIGYPFDTLYERTFPNEVIASVEIADIEGDGYNDIIVTTFDSTYIIGSVIPRIISVLEPRNLPTPAPEFCPGDTVKIKWRNILRGSNSINLRFQEMSGGNPVGSLRKVIADIPNLTDTVVYAYVVDSSVMGRTGYFVVESSGNPEKVYDTTSVMKFNSPYINVNLPGTLKVNTGGPIVFTGTGSCVDSVRIEISYNDSVWTSLASESMESSGTFTIKGYVPCMNFFDCLSPKADSLIHARLISYRSVYADTSVAIPVRLVPANFPVMFDTSCPACPDRVFTWNTIDMPFICDTVIAGYSADGGRTFTEIGKISAREERYIWKVALNVPDSLIFSFCCENSCIRTDTLIKGLKPKMLGIAAPNPFRPPDEPLEFVYEVPVATTVNIVIYDQNNRQVYSVVKSAERNPGVAYCDRWNGMTNDGSTASNGIYYLSLELSNGIREVYPVFVKK